MSEDPNKKNHLNLFYKIEKSALATFIGIILLFISAIFVVMILPLYMENSWTLPSSPYMKQIYEVEDPSIFIGSASPSGVGGDLQQVQHLKQNFTLLAFKESYEQRIVASPEMEKFITHYQDGKLKLTSRLLLLRSPEGEMLEKSKTKIKDLSLEWEKVHPEWQKEGLPKAYFQVLELYDPRKEEIFAYSPSSGLLQNWVDVDFYIIDEALQQPYHKDYGVVYVQNPQEYRISPIQIGENKYWRYDPLGKGIKDISELKKLGMDFLSKKELIALGEHIYAIEGCWYCHTDQTRTLIQDVVLNGSDSYPAPPSSPNEYIYQKITFPGTRRIGPDLSRVGVKRPNRDWHKGHFWSPKTASAGSIMPSFKHFFDNDPRGTTNTMGIPNYRFEAIYQYLMTKGTRITPPTQAWWLGKDPIKTKEIIEGKKKWEPPR